MPIQLPWGTIDALAAFLLVFFRLTGIMVSAPLFSNAAFPVRVRGMLAFLLALVFFPLALTHAPTGTFVGLFRNPVTVTIAVGSELALGWVLGFIASIMVWGAQLAGHILDQEIGLSLGEVFDPVSQTQSSASAQLLFTLGLLAFILLDGHHLLLGAAARTFEFVPPGTFPFTLASGEFLARDLGSSIWETGLRMALPGMVALLMVTVAMAILARVVPEMNIFIIGFSIRILFGLISLFLVLPFLADVFRITLSTTSLSLVRLLEMFRGA